MLHFFVFQMGQCHGGGHYFIASAKLNKWRIHSVTAAKLPAACELSPSVRIRHIRPFVGYWVTIQTPGRFFLKGILLYGEEQQNPRVGFHKSLQEQLRYLKYITWEKNFYFFCFHLFFSDVCTFSFFFFFCFSGVFYPTFHWTVKPLCLLQETSFHISFVAVMHGNCKDMKNNLCFRVVCISCKGGTERYLVFWIYIVKYTLQILKWVRWFICIKIVIHDVPNKGSF